MAEFAKERKGRFSIWLNSLFAMPERPFYRQTGVQWSFGLVVIALGTFIFLQQSSDVKVLAENNVSSQEASNAEARPGNSTQPNSSNQAIPSKPEVDLSGMDKLPQAPVVLAQVQPVMNNVPQEDVGPKVQNYKSVASEESIAESDAVDMAMAPPAPEVKQTELEKDAMTNNTATTLSAGASTTSQNIKFIQDATIFISSAESTQMTNYAELLEITFTAR
jgi:hypothetical protein